MLPRTPKAATVKVVGREDRVRRERSRPNTQFQSRPRDGQSTEYQRFRAGVDIRIIQLMLGHASVQQTQRYLNVTDEELRKGLEVSWKRRTLKAVAGGQSA